MFSVSFKITWVLYYVVFSIVFAFIAMIMDPKFGFIDSVFTTVSAMTGAGLTTIPMHHVTKGVFILLGTLILIGNPVFMMLVTMLYRRHCYWKLCCQILVHQRNGILPRKILFTPETLYIIQDYEQVDDALELLIWIVLAYYLFWVLFGAFILYWTLTAFPLQPELKERNFNYFDAAVFIAVNGFGNAGFTLTTDNLIGIRNNPAAYLWLTVLIVAGNTGLPIMLRCLLTACIKVEEWMLKHYSWVATDVNRLQNRKTLKFILDNPRRLSTHLFSYFNLLDSGLTPTEIAGIGYFQTLSTRTAGFSMMDLRQLNQGLLFIYCVMMYLSAFPFVTTLHATTNVRSSTNSENIISRRGTSSFVIKSRSGPDRHSSGSADDSPNKQSSTKNNNITSSSTMNTQQHSSKDQKRNIPVKAVYEQSIASYFKGSMLRQRRQAQEDYILTSQIGSTDKLLPLRDDDVNGNDKSLQDYPNGVQQVAGKHYLLRHSFFIFLAVVICAFSENNMLANPKVDVNLWYIIFEIVSAYGAVGLSFGYPGQPYSLSGAMSPLGKLTIIFVMLMGKHRGLPSPNDEVVDFDFKRLRHACGYYRPDELTAQEDESFQDSELEEGDSKQVGEQSKLPHTVCNPLNNDEGSFV